VSQVDLLSTICEIAGADASGVDGRSILPVPRDPDAPFREFLLIEAEDRGWHSVRMRRRDQAGADYADLLFVKWQDGFEEIYDYLEDPPPYEGRVGTPREQSDTRACSARGSSPCVPPPGIGTGRWKRDRAS
jgi:hypothetical protein